MKTLILVRHAHRDRLMNDADNGLSSKGLKQARAVRRFYKRRYREVLPELLSSPKKRCVETLAPLAEWLGTSVKIEPSLDENGDLDAKIAKFMKAFQASHSEIVIACSHGDWIPRALELWTGVALDVNKGAWVELDWMGRAFMLRWVVQELRKTV